MPAGVTVVSGLHTVAAEHLADLDHAFDEDVLHLRRRQRREARASPS